MALLITARRIVVLSLFSNDYRLPSSVFFCFLISNTDTMAVKASVAGAAIHTPVIPHIAGKIITNASSSTIPLRSEMIAELKASPQLVKYIEFITSYPIIRNVTA